MDNRLTFKTALLASLLLHLMTGFFLWSSSSNSPQVVQEVAKNENGRNLPIEIMEQPEPEIIKAQSFDEAEVMAAVNQLKAERQAAMDQEDARQQSLKKLAETAKLQRIKEQAHIAKLKEEAVQLALAHKKELAAEQEHLKNVLKEKERESRRLEQIKQKQMVLEKHQEKIEAEKKKLEAEKALKEKEEARLKQAAKERAEKEAENKAKIAGEVNKYKALILNAIAAKWIIPENTSKNLSSQFRIRLAPDGAVLEVTLTRSSGDTLLDRSAKTAIYKASPLPVPADVLTFNLFRDISLTVRPVNVRG